MCHSSSFLPSYNNNIGFASSRIRRKVLLPVTRRREQVTEAQDRNLMTSRNLATQLTALVVDDNILNRKIHQKMLTSIGVECMGVTNGKEAVDVHCYGQSFDLILMDKDMPIMNGIEATKKLRSMGICSMIVGVSSRFTEAEIQDFMEAGLNDYHEKPLTNAKLCSIINKINPK